MSKRFNQKGFTLVEALLIIIALALVIFVGYYVYHANQSTKEPAPPTALNNANTQSTSKPAEQQKQYLKFDELGVKVPYSDNLQSMTFAEDSNVPKTLYAHSSRLDKATPCFNSSASEDTSPSANSFMAVTRVTGQYSDKRDEDTGMTLLKQFNTFHIVGSYPNGGVPCEMNDQQIDNYSNVKHALTEQLTSALKLSEEL